MDTLALPLPVLLCAWMLSRRKRRVYTAMSADDVDKSLSRQIAIIETILTGLDEGYLNKLLRVVLLRYVNSLQSERMSLQMLKSFGPLTIGFIPIRGDKDHEAQKGVGH